MRQFLAWLGISVALAILFLIGVIVQQPFLLVSGFCLWTPVTWMVGFAFARAGGHIRSPINLNAQPKKQPISKTEFN